MLQNVGAQSSADGQGPEKQGMSTESSLKAIIDRLSRAQKIARIGSWENYLPTGELTWSEEMYEILGFERNSPLILSEIMNIFPPEERTNFGKALEAALTHDVPYSMDYRIIRPDGQVRYIHDEGEVERDAEGNAVFMHGTTQDITDRKLSELAFRTSEERYKLLFETANDSIFLVKDEVFIECNKFTLNIFGCNSREDILGHSPWEFSPALQPDGAESVAKAKQFMQMAMDNNPQSFYWKHTRKNGEPFDTEVSLNKVDLPGGPHIQAIVHDISERMEAEQQNLLLAHTLRSVKDCISITDLNDIILFVNEAFVSTYGYSEEELIGRDIKMLRPKGILQDEETSILAATRLDGWHGELINVRKDGSEFPIELWSSIVKDRQGNQLAMVGVARDISERKRLEAEINKAVEKAEESSRLKSSLLSNISHELRTPMNGILGYAEILKEMSVDAESSAMAETILFSANRLMATLNSLMDLSQIEADSQKLHIQPVNLSDLTREVMRNFTDVAARKNLRINDAIKPSVFARADLDLCRHILHNLIDNALKFTEKGSVTVVLELEKEDHQDWALLKIMDSGIGIPLEFQQMIFDDFRQVSEGIGRTHEGMGIGLSLCKRFVNLLNGSIAVDSKPGIGSVFTVRFVGVAESAGVSSVPEEVIREPERSLKEMLPGRMPHVLLVEDNEHNLELMEIYLQKVCFTERAYDGLTAVKMAFVNQFDAVVMDINLGPGMDGLEAGREIRSIRGYENIPLIAVTGYTTSDEQAHIMAQGFTHYLPKPFNRQELVSKIIEALRPAKNK